MNNRYTQDNTEGFSDRQLKVLNYVFAALVKRLPEIDPVTISDALLNSWVEENESHWLPVGNDFYSLAGRTSSRLGCYIF